jgi:GTP-binding protein Era
MTMPKAKTPREPKSPPKKPRAPKKITTKVGYVALIGRPNAGKSTLINKMLGQKIAIISDKPQTTRISILGIHTTENGQIIFIDNPGIHKPLHKLNKRMMNFVYSSLQTADIVCLLIDAAEKFGHGDEHVLEMLKDVKRPVFLLINKVDIVKKDHVLLLIDKYKDLMAFTEIIPISAVKGTNLDVLEKLLYENLPTSEKLYGDEDVSDQSEKFLLSEIIREKVLKYVEKELPWATAVFIDSIEKRKGDEDEQAAKGVEDWDDDEVALEKKDKMTAGGGEKTPDKSAKPEPLAPKAPPRKPDPDHMPGVGPTPRKKRPLTYIKASIFVEKDGQRGIIIGRHGQFIKQVGIDARREIEEILETKVYLELQVKVREEWRDKADVLDMIEGQKVLG